jgi:hypothetical protein
MWRGVRYEEDPQSRGNTRVQTGAWHPEKARNESRGLLGTGEFPRIANQSAGTCMDLVASPALPLPLISPTPPPSRRVRLQHGCDLLDSRSSRACVQRLSPYPFRAHLGMKTFAWVPRSCPGPVYYTHIQGLLSLSSPKSEQAFGIRSIRRLLASDAMPLMCRCCCGAAPL